mgnify:CR=1 FL=1
MSVIIINLSLVTSAHVLLELFPSLLLVIVCWLVEGLSTPLVRYTSGWFSYCLLCYFKIIAWAKNVQLFRNNTMGRYWIDLECTSPYLFTSPRPIEKTFTNQRLGTGLVSWGWQSCLFCHQICMWQNRLISKPHEPLHLVYCVVC